MADESAVNANLAVDIATEGGDVGENPSFGDIGESSEGPASLNLAVGPPSPLTGCYLLIVVGEPYSEEHKDVILQKLLKGLLSWSAIDCHVNLEEELNTITTQALEGEEGKNGERLIQYASENLVTEILIHPQTNTFIQCMRNLLSSFTRHRHIIHAGYTFTGNGSWILQDGTFSVLDFCDAFLENEVQRVLRAYPDTITIDIHCAQLGHWSSLPDKNFTKLCKIRINPVDVLDSGNEKLNAFTNYLSSMVCPGDLHSLLESSEVVGNIRFSHPTLYVFPGGQGDSALFGINGFNMLVDGGFPRKACFWDFVRHLDRLDAVLMTRMNNSNICGMSSVIERKSSNPVYPQIGHFFANIPERRAILSPDGDKDRNPLELDLIEEGSRLVSNLKAINLKPQTCYRDNEPINLYHKVGHGTLDMYIISPSKDSKEVKEFLQKWHANDQKLFTSKDSKEFNFPLQNVVSICALLVWQPANPDDNITRILFPGSTPDSKIFEGLEKVKALEFLKHPICTVKTVTPSLSTSILSKKALKSERISDVSTKPFKDNKHSEKKAEMEKKPESEDKPVQRDNRLIEEQADENATETKVEKIVIKTVTKAKTVAKQVKSEVKKVESKKSDVEKVVTEKSDKDETEVKSNDDQEVPSEEKEDKTVIKKEEEPAELKPRAKISKPKTDTKTQVKSRIDSKPPKAMEKKSAKKDDKDKSSPTTPKKLADTNKLPNGSAVAVKDILPKDKEPPIKAKAAARLMKASPKSTPAKSTKDANNRKVLEARQKPAIAGVSRVAKVEETKKEVKSIEKKAITKRVIRKAGSPMKTSRKDTAVKKAVKLEKNETTDSSLVSTPSADDVQKKIVGGSDPRKQKELKELKEERDAVREIEAVFQKDQDKRRTHGIILDHRELHESTTEVEEEEEYLIIEKEEPYTEDSINEHESQKDDDAAQNVQRDSDDSEKKLKDDSKEKEPLRATADENQEEDGEAKDEEVDDNQLEDEAKNLIKEEIKIEVQDILMSATEIAKNKMETSFEGLQRTEELSAPSPDDKLSSAKKTTETKDDDQKEGTRDEIDPIMIESQPEEKFSATSGATTAPTMPEDEKVQEGPPLDEIKEDQAFEEKYNKEETKENEIIVTKLPTVFEPLLKEQKIGFGQSAHLRDIVKTPDEVADLPMHEVVDYQGYVEYSGKRPEKPEETNKFKQEEETVEATSPDLKLSEEIPQKEVSEVVEEKIQIREVAQEFATEIRETHITTIESPLIDDKAADFEDLKKDQKPSYQIEEIKFIPIEREDSGLNDIKEEDDEHGISPPMKHSPEHVEKLSASPKHPPRARTPEEVMKIVTKVAEVLKTDKDLEEIIPDFDPEELERRLSSKPITDDENDGDLEIAPTVQRMLVTASSEDGGVETEICPEGSINFTGSSTPEKLKTFDLTVTEDIAKTEKDTKTPSSSGKSSPELKTSTVSVEEKEKNEIPEKETQITKAPEIAVPKIKKEEADLVDLRRESAFSMMSEKDYTKDESSIVIEKVQSRSQSITSNILDLEHDEHFEDEIQKMISNDELSRIRKESIQSNIKTSPMKVDERKESVASINTDSKLEVEIDDSSRPASQASVVSEKYEILLKSDESENQTEKKEETLETELTTKAADLSFEDTPEVKPGDENKSDSRPASQASIVSDKSIPAKLESDEGKESIISVSSDKKLDVEKEESRPASQASVVSDKSVPAKLESDERKESIISVSSDKELDVEKEESRPASQASVVSDKSVPAKLESVERKESIISVSSDKKLDVEKEESRPASQASVGDQSVPAKLESDDRKESIISVSSDKKLDVEKEESRPASQASVGDQSVPAKLESDERKESIISVSSDKELDVEKEESRPASQASIVSDKSIPAKLESDDRKESIISVSSDKKLDVEKEESRPASQASVGDQSVPAKLESDERKESIISVSSDKELDVEKEESRPASKASVVSDKSIPAKLESDDRKESIISVSSDKKLDVEKEESRPASQASVGDQSVPAKLESDDRKESIISVSSDKKVDVEKEESRPASQASIVSDQSVPAKLESDDRKESIISVSSDKKLDVEKEESRLASQASVGDQSVPAKLESDDRKESIISVSSDKKLDVEKEESRLASQASVGDQSVPAKLESVGRKESIISVSSDKKVDVEKEESRPASQASVGDQSIPAKLESDERKESIISVSSDKKLDVEKEESRPASQASIVSDKSIPAKLESVERKESIISVSSDKKLDVEKEESRPASQASIVSDQSIPAKLESDDRKESIISVSSDKKLDVEKEESRPASQASIVSDKSIPAKLESVERKESIISVSSDKKLDVEKEESRPASQASIVSDKSIPAKLESVERKESIISVSSDKKVDVEKEESRPASQASIVSDKSIPAKLESVERKESIISVSSDKKVDVEKEESRPASQASIASDKSVPAKLESVARKESIISLSSDTKLDVEKEESRPASQASVGDQSIPAKLESVERKESIISLSSDKELDVEKEESRPASQASIVSDKSIPAKLESVERKESIISVSSDKKLDVEKEESRPASQASIVSDKSIPAKLESVERKESIISVSSDKKVDVEKEESRPASQASIVSDKSIPAKLESVERKESIISVSSDKKVDVEKEESRPASQASIVSDKSIPAKLESVERKESIILVSSDKKVDVEKEESRPASQASIVSDKSIPAKLESVERKESIISVSSDKKVDVEKEESRPASQASIVSDKSIPAKLESVERKESIISVSSDKKVDVEKEESRPASQASVVSGKSVSGKEENVLLTGSHTFINDKNKVPPGLNVNEKSSLQGLGLESKISMEVSPATASESIERPESPSSACSGSGVELVENYGLVEEVVIRRKSSVSAASDHTDRDESFSRPETPPSAADDINYRTLENISNSVQIENDTDERRESVSKAEKLFESRRESNKSVDDSSVTLPSAFPLSKLYDESDDKIFMKESRSKSVSSVCSTSSKSEDFGKLSAIEEFVSASKDDLANFSNTVEEKLPQNIKVSETISHTITTTHSSVSSSFPMSADQLKEEVSAFPITEKIETSSMSSTLCEDLKLKIEKTRTEASEVFADIRNYVKAETADITDTLGGKKTPPTVPVSPNVITQKSQKESTEKESAFKQSSDVTGKISGISTPKGSVHSGRSSPDSGASKSIALGHGSAIEESPDSSPKPTSPFPKTIDALKSEDDHKTSSGISTPDMTRTPTPDTTEKLVETSKSSVLKEEISEFKSKVHTQDFSFHTDKESFNSKKANSDKDSTIDSYHSQWTTSYKHDDDDNAYSHEQHFAYEEDDVPPQYEEVKSTVSISSTFKSDPMSTSFYGSLPESTTSDNATSVPIPITTTVTRTYVEYTSSPEISSVESAKKFTKYLDEADLDFEKTFQQQSPLVTTTSSQIIQSSSTITSSDIKESSSQSTVEKVESSSITKEEKLWDKPLGLPSPAPLLPENGANTTPKRERKTLANKNKLNLQKRSQSPMAGKKLSPVYMDLAYVPHHGNSYYSHVEYFKKIRARYYVFSGTEPSKEAYNALLEAKQTWEDKNLEVTIIPTYDTDVLGYWVSENEELLAKNHIDLSPSAARCTINLQDHETSCSAYRLEF